MSKFSGDAPSELKSGFSEELLSFRQGKEKVSWCQSMLLGSDGTVLGARSPPSWGCCMVLPLLVKSHRTMAGADA